ncbi:3-deoxy-D-manno-octulosonic acid transferase [Vibrio maritimus]|uniref:3-deoxy-D-manno-octulosonic acid transferase n=1 Tax=Vibrio maritimus TaxID=990268 RepID=UPI001F2E77F9|nr:3-deoxy-D-manno-octulosonic acid transferase [Vibrio maritimus]
MNPNLNAERHFHWLYALGFTIGLVLTFLYAQNQILTGDQTQMLHKGYLGAYQGTWLNYGNAASAVGNVPGSLSAWLIGVPLLVWDSPWSPMVLLIALRIVSLVLLDNVIKTMMPENNSALMRLIFLALYWLNPWFLYDSLLYNPSYLCLFAAMHLWSASKMRNHKSFGYTFVHVLSIGLAMQLHYSWPILAVISCYLFYRQMGQISWVGAVSAIAVLLLSLVPYFQEYAVNDDIKRESDRYIGYGIVHVYPVLKAVLYWLRYGSMLFSNKVIAYGEFDWLTQIEWIKLSALSLWKALVFVVGAITVVVSAKFNWTWWKRVKPICLRGKGELDNQQWIELYVFGAIVGVLISASLSPITFSYWHLIMVYPFAILPILIGIRSIIANEESERNQADASRQTTSKFSRFVQRYSVTTTLATWFTVRDKQLTLLKLSLGYLLVLNLLASHDSIKYSFEADYVQQTEQYLLEQNLVKLHLEPQ